MKFKAGVRYVIREECWKNKEKWVKSMKDKVGGNYLHVRWCISGKEDYINQWCIEREATEEDINEALVEAL